jgi:CHASE2 domain-containing sensor protein/two-component sensor histidine kinase
MRLNRPEIFRRVEAAIADWQIGILPGLIVIGLVIIARLSGSLQVLEWMVFDQLLHLRPEEALDERIVIVGIDEFDIRQIGQYPIPDRDLAALLTQIQSFSPSVIGLDVVRDLPVEPGHADLLEILQTSDQIIGIESVVPDKFGFTIDPPPTLPPAQIGFVDAVLDNDGNLRRSLLGAISTEGDYRLSFTIKLAEAYLAEQGLTLGNGIRDPKTMRFGATELKRFHPNSGSYVQADAGGLQTLLNFRSGAEPFRIVSFQEVLSGNVDPDWFRDRIVIIGIVAASAGDYVNSAAVNTVNPGLVSGVEVQAHAVSQIISAALNGRPFIYTWQDGYEYIWIIAWGMIGLSLGRLISSPTRHFLAVAVIGVGVIIIGYLSLIAGWWIPIVPALLAFFVNGTVLHAFYLYDQSLKTRIYERQRIIDQTFNAIHNGPLQTLAIMLRKTQEPDCSGEQLYLDLCSINQELRGIQKFIGKETLTQANHLYLSSGQIVDLQVPLHESLYEVYINTIERDLPYFKSIKAKLVKFEDMNGDRLTIEQKRDLCRFLEEALCNVGKHASGVTRLSVTCLQENNHNVIRVIDNGIEDQKSLNSPELNLGGRGTQQAQQIAQQLRGTFRRITIQDRSLIPHFSQGTLCELTWSATSPRFQPISAMLSVFGNSR